MAKLLYIEASPRKERSKSILVAKAFLAKYQSTHPGDEVQTLDLWDRKLPAFDGFTIDAKYQVLHGQGFDDRQKGAWQAVVDVCDEFKSADKYLFSLPMWNFGIPYKLKHYIDVIAQPGQRITAGTGITHSEFNPSRSNATHFYQIWLLPERKGISPSYDQKRFAPEARQNQWQLVASRAGVAGSLVIHQDANVYLADLTAGNELSHAIPKGRHAWLQVLRGSVHANSHLLQTSDAIGLSEEGFLSLSADDRAEVMLFDLA